MVQWVAAFALAVVGCQGSPQGTRSSQVVAYVSVDQHHAEPLLKSFEELTGIRVLAAYDVEAAKTTGLVNRLIAERDRPQADLYWSGEFAQTILLEEEGLLLPYASPSAADLPPELRDPENRWTGFAGRARVLLVNADLVEPEEYPTGIVDLLDPRWPADRIAIALPLFGTTATHAAALYAAWGPPAARRFLQQLKDRGVRVEAGNASVRDLVADGTLMWGLTDTDDAAGALSRNAPVAVVFPDQGDGQLGTLVIPNTVAIIKGAQHLEQARRLADYLLSIEVERQMVASGWCHVPYREVGVEPRFIDGAGVRRMEVNLEDVYEQMQAVQQELPDVFIR